MATKRDKIGNNYGIYTIKVTDDENVSKIFLFSFQTNVANV